MGSRPRRRLSLRYRIAWRTRYALLHVFGPPTLGGIGQPDPRQQMRAERAAREAGPTATG